MLFLHLRQDLTGQLVSNLQEGWCVVSVLAGEMEEGGRGGERWVVNVRWVIG